MRTPTRRRVRRLRDNPEGQMTILEHLTELRDRLLRCVLALFITTTVAFVVVYEPVLRFVTKSYCDIPAKYRVATAGGGCRLLALSPLDPIGIRIRVALTVGLLVAMPYLAYQLWRFITPGLKRSEKRYAVPFALASTILFAMGVAGGGGDHHRGGGGDHPQPGPHQPVRHGDPHVDLLLRRRRGRQVAHRAGPRPTPRPTRASHQHAVGAADHRGGAGGPVRRQPAAQDGPRPWGRHPRVQERHRRGRPRLGHRRADQPGRAGSQRAGRAALPAGRAAARTVAIGTPSSARTDGWSCSTWGSARSP